MTLVPGVTREQLTSMVEMIAESWPMMREEVSDEPNVDSLCCLFCCSNEPDDNGQPVRKENLRKRKLWQQLIAVMGTYARSGKLKCPTCQQIWTGGTVADMGKECASFVCQKYPVCVELKICALGIKRYGIEWSRTYSMKEQECAAEEVLSAIEESNCVSHSAILVLEKMYSLSMLGDIAFDHNNLPAAIQLYEQSEAAARALGYGGNDIQMMDIQMQIAKAQRALRGDAPAYTETLLPFLRAHFAKSKEVYGKDNRITLRNGCNINEARELLADLHTKAHRVLGPQYNLTRDIKHLVDEISTSRVD
eukprot:scaffold125429_cov52-Cyclotella_meneghiniana.AAC.1